MKVYLASNYRRRDELLAVKAELEELHLGYQVVSRWLIHDPDTPAAKLVEQADVAMPDEAQQFAVVDYEDVQSADVLVLFSDPVSQSGQRGGCHVEFGMALAWRKPVVVVGPRQNVFHTLPDVVNLPEYGARGRWQLADAIRWATRINR